MPRTAIRCLTLALAIAVGAAAAAQEEGDPADRVVELIERLDADRAADRVRAETELLKLAAESPKRLLAELPADSPRLPASIRTGIGRVRLAAERQVAKRATAASTVTLQSAQAPLAEVLGAIEEQTGNRLVDRRAEFGGEPSGTVTVTAEGQPFWRAVDAVLDSAGLSVYPYGDDDALTLIARPEGERRRAGRGAYAGPFRFETLRAVSTRGLRDRGESTLRLDVEVAWEPRLRPIALSQRMADFVATTDDGLPLAPQTAKQSIDLEVSPGAQTLEMNLPFLLPERSIERIAGVRGSLTALVPATRHEFKVEGVGAAGLPITQSHGDATVTLERFSQNNAIWELHMRLTLGDAGDALASHRGWVFRNPSYLVDGEGKRYEHAGFETTVQTESQVGVAYFFDLSGETFDFDAAPTEDDAAEPVDPAGLTWVYETPTGVYSVPVEYELGPIALP